MEIYRLRVYLQGGIEREERCSRISWDDVRYIRVGQEPNERREAEAEVVWVEGRAASSSTPRPQRD